MKKFIKIFSITIVSLLALFLIIVTIALWLVFTPERLTPIVRKQADKYIACKSEFGEVELTFFSTFPNIGIKVKELALINPVEGASYDTLVRVNKLVGVVDAAAWWKSNELKLIGLELTGGSVNIFSDSLGNTNYAIMTTDTTSLTEPESETILPDIDIRNISLNDINFNYTDISSKINTAVTNLTAEIRGTILDDNISGNIKVSRSGVSLEFDGEKYLHQASLKIDMPVKIIPSRQLIEFSNASFTINDLALLLNGTVENDTINKNLITGITYNLDSWPVKSMLDLVPPSFKNYLKGIDADGLLTSSGSITGIMNDSVMPLLDIHLLVENGALKYSGFPLPLHDINGDVTISTDLKTDSLSFVNLKQFTARTPLSYFSTEGTVSHLFTDIYCNLTTNARLTLNEFDQLIPDSMKLSLKGKVQGKVNSVFKMSQIEKMQLERMKLSGSVTLSDFDVAYDSISFKTGRSRIDFQLPNNKASAKNTRFAFATLVMDYIETGKIDSYSAFLKNASVTFETSDVRDTTRIPDLICSFDMESLSASMDTMNLAIANPKGSVTVAPRPESPDQPRITLSYLSDHLKAVMGQNSFEVKKINIDTDILNDNTQKDVFLQWLVKGFIHIEQGNVIMAGLSHPVEIPSVKLNFEPETFNIKESKFKIDRSDFELSGNLNNVLSYFRGDSILRGKFNFVSNTTDVLQLMAITNGIGQKDTIVAEQSENQVSDSVYAGPYMVPRGIDVLLSANIKTATMGIDTATNILGSVRIHDGSLVLDGLTFETPAARMQLTTLYRTPRKNHLFLGLDYHMLDVEIGELLTMIPDIDSLMPMLRSFGGKGEFHIAVETYLDSMYNIKKSTLRGASSVKGNDLILMDGETFSEIAKTLKFNKKTENKVDSLSAEFTIFRNEIDIYPFLIVMDKYKAVIAGRHNFDLTFDYHVSVVDCPIPVKLGVDVKGNMDDLSYSLARCRYAEYYRPSARGAVENKQLELRKMIRETLTQKVID